MQRFNTWNAKYSPDFWKDKFKPDNLINIVAHANSIIAQREDSKILERYDINEIDNHKLGTAYIWIPITLPDPKYDAASNSVYPWSYEIDKNWLFIDAIYDKHVDPTINLQHDIDFIYESGTGVLRFAKEIKNDDGVRPPLYISKGWYSEYRIYNEIGHLLNYLDRDSVTYRDNIAPLLASLYLGPTYFHLLAILNILIGLPVTKFEGEVVQSVLNGIIITDKNSYNIGNVHTTIKKGDVLHRFQPLTDAVELNTEEIRHDWWRGKPASIFQKYVLDREITDDLRDELMENYLYNSLAGVEFRQDKLHGHNIKINDEILDIFYKAAPSRSDFLFAQTYHVGESYDYKNIMLANLENTKIKLDITSLYGRFDHDWGVNGQFAFSVKNIPYPTINHRKTSDTDPGTYEKGKSLTFNDGIWHIRSDALDGLYEFWRFNDIYGSHEYRVAVEPWSDTVYMRFSEDKHWFDRGYKRIPFSLPDEYKPTIFLDDHALNKSNVTLGLNGPTGPFSDMSELPALSHDTRSYLAIASDSKFDIYDFDNTDWGRYNIVLVGEYATVAGDESLPLEDRFIGYLTTSKINLGVVPKDVRVSIIADIPTGAIIEILYTQNPDNNAIWTHIEQNQPIKNVTGGIYFRFKLLNNVSILRGNPKLKTIQMKIEKGV